MFPMEQEELERLIVLFCADAYRLRLPQMHTVPRSGRTSLLRISSRICLSLVRLLMISKDLHLLCLPYVPDSCFKWNKKYWIGPSCSSAPMPTDCGCPKCTPCLGQVIYPHQFTHLVCPCTAFTDLFVPGLARDLLPPSFRILPSTPDLHCFHCLHRRLRFVTSEIHSYPKFPTFFEEECVIYKATFNFKFAAVYIYLTHTHE